MDGENLIHRTDGSRLVFHQLAEIPVQFNHLAAFIHTGNAVQLRLDKSKVAGIMPHRRNLNDCIARILILISDIRLRPGMIIIVAVDAAQHIGKGVKTLRRRVRGQGMGVEIPGIETVFVVARHDDIPVHNALPQGVVPAPGIAAGKNSGIGQLREILPAPVRCRGRLSGNGSVLGDGNALQLGSRFRLGGRRIFPHQGPADQHCHLATGDNRRLSGGLADPAQASGVLTSGTVVPHTALAVLIPTAPKNHRTGHGRSDRIIRPVAGCVIAGHQQVGSTVTHIGLCPGRNVGEIAGPGVVIWIDCTLPMEPGENGGHFRPCQPLVQHQVAGAVPLVDAPLPQVRPRRLDLHWLLRRIDGNGHAQAENTGQSHRHKFLHH